MTKKLLTAVFLTVAFCSVIKAQEEFKPSGSPYANIFINFNTNFEEISAFEASRAYFGYKYKMSPEWTGNVLFDAGTSEVSIGDSLKVNTSLDFTVFLKNANLTFKKDKLSIDMGMISVNQFKLQETYWGHRYIMKSFQDEYKMTTSADLGVLAIYDVLDILSIDVILRNGEGYKKIQSDNAFLFGGGFALIPIKGLAIRGYYDYHKKSEAQVTLAHFVGYKNEKISVGAEYNYQISNKNKKDHDLNGYSFYASYDFTNKYQLFGRFDNISSNTLEGDTVNWNIGSDGNRIIAGFQYTPIKNIQFALNYQGWLASGSSDDNKNFLFLNCNIKF